MKILLNFLSILVCLNLVLTPLSPALIYAQDDDYSYPYPAPYSYPTPEYPTPEYDYPTPYEYPTPSEPEPQEPEPTPDDFDDFIGEVPEAPTQEPELPQEPEPIEGPQEPELPPILDPEQDELANQPVQNPLPTPVTITDPDSQDDAIDQNQNNASQPNQNQQQEQQAAREEQNGGQNPTQAIVQAPGNLTEAISGVTQESVQIAQDVTRSLSNGPASQIVDDNLSEQFADMNNQTQEQTINANGQIAQTLFKSEEERVSELASFLNLPEGSSSEEVIQALRDKAQVAGVQIDGDINNFEIKIPAFLESGTEISSLDVDQLKQENDRLRQLGELLSSLNAFGQEASLSITTFGVSDWTRYVNDTVDQAQRDTEKLDLLDKDRKVDPRISALIPRENYRTLAQMSDGQLDKLAGDLEKNYGFDKQSVLNQIKAERDWRNLAHDIKNKQQSLALEATVNFALLAAGLVPGAGTGVRTGVNAAKPTLREIKSLIPQVGRLSEREAVFVGHLQEAREPILSRTIITQTERDFSNIVDPGAGKSFTRKEVIDLAIAALGRTDEEAVDIARTWYIDEIPLETISRSVVESEKLLPEVDRINALILEQTAGDKVIVDSRLRAAFTSDRPLSRALDQYVIQTGDLRAHDYSYLKEHPEVLVDAVIREQVNSDALANILGPQRELYGTLEKFVQDNLDPSFVVQNQDVILDAENVHVIPQYRVGQRAGSPDTGGLYLHTNQSGGRVLIASNYSEACKVGICTHEFGHRAKDINGLDQEDFVLLYNLAGDKINGREAYRIIDEAVTEHSAQVAFRESKRPEIASAYMAYLQEIAILKNKIIPAIMQNSGMTFEQAEALVVKTDLTGKFRPLVDAAGGEDVVRKILNETVIENPVSDVAVFVPTTRDEKKLLASTVTAMLLAESVAFIPGQPVPTSASSNPIEATWNNFNDSLTTARENTVTAINDIRLHPTEVDQRVGDTINRAPADAVNNVIAAKDRAASFFGGLFGGNDNVKGATTQVNEAQAIDADAFELLTKREIIKDDLRNDGKTDSGQVRNILQADVLNPEFIAAGGGYSITTGRSGIVEGNIKPGKYVVEIGGIKGTEVKVPDVVEIEGSGNLLIPVAIKPGEGEVKKVSYDRQSWVSPVNAQDPPGGEAGNSAPRVTVVVFSDQNGNGRLDKNEEVLPWAGVSADLREVEKDRVVSLLSGWNLITLTSLPSTPLNASGLLTQIAQDGGYATAVSTLENGSWKTYVMRGDKSFSGDDFAIEPGRAYFLKSQKRSVMIFKGQDFVEPVKVNLSSGWNAVGFPKTSKSYDISDILTKAGADASSRWESGLWDSFIRQPLDTRGKQEEYGNNFPIERNRGYIIRTKAGGEFAP